MDASPTTLFAAFGSGVLVHLGYFHRGEHFLYPLRYIQAVLLGIAAGTFAQVKLYNSDVSRALSLSVQHAAVLLAGLYTSLLIYRLFFNPLNKLPGPYWARVTKFDHVLRNKKLNAHHIFQGLHKKYGKVVRIGPNDVSVIDADAVKVIHGADTKCTKSQWYQQDTPLISMHTSRDKAMHDRRRRVWSPAFSVKALDGYSDRMQVYIDQLVEKVYQHEGEPMEMQSWLNLLSFDIMGDLAFGEGFDMVAKGEEHWAIKLLSEGMDPLGLMIPQWLFRTLVAIPGAATGYFKFINFCNQQLDKRIKKHGKGGKADICNTLIDHYMSAEDKKTLLPMLQGDCRLIIVAGSDTTAATLTHMFYHLARLPELQDRIRREIRELKQGDPIKDEPIRDAPFLMGAIKETLRLNPPVPSGVFRKTPPEGLDVNGTYIPGDTVIQMPGYVMGHDSENYVDPEEFIPERWGEKEDELIKKRDAFAPFSIGPYSCIGRDLAYREVRVVTAQLIDKFDVSLAPGEDGSKLLNETTDHFTLGLAPLKLCFKKRKDYGI